MGEIGQKYGMRSGDIRQGWARFGLLAQISSNPVANLGEISENRRDKVRLAKYMGRDLDNNSPIFPLLGNVSS